LNDQFYQRLAGFASLAAAIGVIVGAFGAHSLKSRIPPESLEVLKTGVLYLFVHSLACLLIVALPKSQSGNQFLKISGLAFLAGIILFSGSLFVISTQTVTGIEIGAFGIVTPLGGLCFIVGWSCLVFWGLRPSRK
jgi:uncharacterized membrane protein YgdD (TMEM256/DUF423 family)